MNRLVCVCWKTRVLSDFWDTIFIYATWATSTQFLILFPSLFLTPSPTKRPIVNNIWPPVVSGWKKFIQRTFIKHLKLFLTVRFFFEIVYTKEQALFKTLVVFSFEFICVQDESFKNTLTTKWIGKRNPFFCFHFVKPYRATDLSKRLLKFELPIAKYKLKICSSISRQL